MTESKSSRKRYNVGRQEVLYGSIKASRQSNDCPCAAQANEIPAILAENATAGIQSFNPASVANSNPSEEIAKTRSARLFRNSKFSFGSTARPRGSAMRSSSI